MFVGHYSAAFAARAFRPAVPLWVLFIAVQLVDFAFMAFIMMNVEHVRVVPDFTAASDLDLYFMPYTHSLTGAAVWAIAGGTLYGALRNGARAMSAGLIVAGAVISHWLLDFAVHVPDLPLLYGEPKVGLGLWRSLVWSQSLELGLLFIGFAIYLANTRPKGMAGRIAPWLLIAFMVALQAYNLMAPPDPEVSMLAMGTLGLVAYTSLAVAAAIAGQFREPAP